ncbi:hypothetical protein [Rhodohalobacter sp. 8-1]|uniref:hypothetical protein n=1 Tax=Rhodohalobacter sp. 8-1 TaxID=3131972 RepID=UPI0030ECEFA9
MLTSFSVQWFTAYYVSLGTLLIGYGIYLIVKRHQMADYLHDVASTYDEPPQAFKSVLKYLLLFTLPGLILSFFPFSWIELIFTIWSLIIIYTVGQMLLQWPVVSQQILASKSSLHKKIRFAGINMVSIGVVLFLLCFILISKY